MDLEKLDEKVNALILGLPQELSTAIRTKVAFYKTKMSAEEVYAEARNLVRLEMMAYLDRRVYLGMYNRRWSEYKISEYIGAIVAKKSEEEKNLYTLARLNFDLNGLKALNDLGGHEAGNRGLKLFANILNFGATTLWLRDELGLEVTASAEGGDEFGIIIMGDKDLRVHIEEIVHRYGKEVYAADVSHFINFSNQEVVENLRLLGIADEVPGDFQFRLSTSVGAVLLGEALHRVDVNRSGVTFDEIVSDITNALFALADKRARVHKSKFKKELSVTNPILSGLYARMSREVIHLERELAAARAHIHELESKTK